MPLILITGASGAGKSTVGRELERRGYRSYDIDEDRLAHWVDNETGVEVRLPADPAHRNDEWHSRHTYRLPPEAVRQLDSEAGDQVVFVCGSTGNEGEIWDLFHQVVSLSVTADTLRRRLRERRHGFGSTDEELTRVLAWHATVDADNLRYGAILVDADDAVPEVVDRLLSRLKRPPYRPT